MGSKNENGGEELCQLFTDLRACLNKADALQLPMVAISICDAADKVGAEIERRKLANEHSGAGRNVNSRLP